MSDEDNDGKPQAMTYMVCGVIIERDGKILLVQEKQPKVYGKWNLPAGKVDVGETLEDAAIREAKEECGLDVEIVDHIFVMHPAVDRAVLHAYTVREIGGEVTFPEDEILDAKWFTRSEIEAMSSELRAAEFVLGAIHARQQ